jgi:uncharacterized protein (DUF1778 family)
MIKRKDNARNITVRFESEAQREQFVAAAEIRKQSLNYFMLCAGEELAKKTLRNEKAKAKSQGGAE